MRRFATSMLAVTLVWVAVTVTVTARTNGSVASVLAISIVITEFAAVGALMCRRVPGNAIGVLYVGVAALAEVGGLAEAYARLDRPASVTAGVIASVLQAAPIVVPLVYTVLLFPDGRVESPRLRPLVPVTAIAAGLATLYSFVSPGPLASMPGVENPYAVGGTPGAVIAAIGSAGYLTMVGVVFAAAGSLLHRYRRAEGVLRQQLKVVGTATGLLAVFFAIGALVLFSIQAAWAQTLWSILFVISVSSVPIATGVAIIRYRLYGIDAVIRRTLVYGILLVVLGGLYLAAIATAGALSRALTGQTGAVAVTLSTLVVAGLAQPLRRRIQASVDRRLFRTGYDARGTLDAFAADLRSEVDLDRLASALVTVAGRCVLPAHASVWLMSVTVPERRSGTPSSRWQRS